LEGQKFPDSIHFLIPNTKKERFLALMLFKPAKGFSYGDGKTNRYYAEGWKSKEQSLSWKLRAINPTARDFRLMIKYLSPAQSSGGKYAIDNRPALYKDLAVAEKRYYFEDSVITDPKGIVPVTHEPGNHQVEPGNL
jgi:hypothetical protein